MSGSKAETARLREVEALASAVGGDKDAASELLRLYGPQVEQCLRIDPAWRAYLDPADVMQVTYIEAFRHIRAFDPQRADRFESWLRQMAENNLRDAIRGLSRQKRGGGAVAGEADLGGPDEGDAGLVLFLSKEPTPDLAAEIAEGCALLLGKLGDAQLRQIALWKMEGDTNHEIADRLRCAPATASQTQPAAGALAACASPPKSRASSSRRASWKAGAMKVTPNGSPERLKPAGTASSGSDEAGGLGGTGSSHRPGGPQAASRQRRARISRPSRGTFS